METNSIDIINYGHLSSVEARQQFLSLRNRILTTTILLADLQGDAMAARTVCSKNLYRSFVNRRLFLFRTFDNNPKASLWNQSVRSCAFGTINPKLDIISVLFKTQFAAFRAMDFASSAAASPGEWICWKCGHKSNGQKPLLFVCPACKVIADPKMIRTRDYFELLNENKTFDLDVKRLAKNFKDLQKILHPDKAVLLSQVEQDYAQELSSLVNKAYDTLQKPLDRGLYLLELLGKPIDEDGASSVRMDPAFLAEMMETNEFLSEMATFGREAANIDARNKEAMNALLVQISQAFAMDRVDDARLLLARLQYLNNIDHKIRQLQLH